MKAQLFVSQSFQPCRAAEQVWREIARANGVELDLVDINSASGREAAKRFGINVVPAVVLNGRLVAVGVQSLEEASRLMDAASAASGQV